MIVGIMQVELMIPQAVSLKDKRRVVRSVKDRIANEFNVSVAEVGGLDRYKQAILGISMVSTETKHIQQCFDKLIGKLQMVRDAFLVDYKIDYL